MAPQGYDLDSEGTLRRSDASFSGTILIAAIIAIVTALLLLAYFILFVYNRLRYPDSEQEDNENPSLDATKSGVRSEGQNPLILTKEDLQPEARRGEKFFYKGETLYERGQSRRLQRGTSSDEKSDSASEESKESTRFHSKETQNESDDGTEKFSAPSTERLPRGTHTLRQLQQDAVFQESRRQKKMQLVGQDYGAYVQRECEAGNRRLAHQKDYSWPVGKQ